jgi:hypothetical protein
MIPMIFCIEDKNPQIPDSVFVSWSGLNISGVWGYNVSVQMKKMPYNKGYIGIGWNDKPYMAGSTMMILTNNVWETEWSLREYIAPQNTTPIWMSKQNFTMEIVNNSLTFTFITIDNINDKYIIFAYAKDWSYHGNNCGIAYTPVSAEYNQSSPMVKYSPRLFKSPNIEYSPSPFTTVLDINVTRLQKTNSSNKKKINLMYLGYIAVIVGVMI